MIVAGPAIAELPTTTVIVVPGHTLSINGSGDFQIEIPDVPNASTGHV